MNRSWCLGWRDDICWADPLMGEQCWMNTLDWELCMCWLIAIRSYYDPEDVEFGEQLQGLLGDMKERRATWLSES